MSSRRQPRARAGAVAVALAAALVAAAGCGEPAPEPAVRRGKVALIGWDGATWHLVEPLVAAGRLPNLARLIDRGGRAVLRAEPPTFSPRVWTTIATGMPASEHGITDFKLEAADGSGRVLAASTHRRRAPLWRMASARERTVGIVGWWTTWPAEPVRGYLVSDHLAYNRWDAWAERDDLEGAYLTFPPSLAERLAPYAVRPEDVGPEQVLPLAAFDEAAVAEMMAATEPVKYHAPSVLRFGYATDASNLAFAEHMLDTVPQPDLFAVVFVLSDIAGHVLWHDYEPGRFPGVAADPALRDALPNVYARLDAWTGELLDRLDPDTTVIVLSDHGMGPSGSAPVPGVSGSGDHELEGIFVAAGPNVPAGADLGVLSQLDVAPTVLALLGEPIAADMPGAPVATIVPAVNLERSGLIATYGDGASDVSPELPSPGEEDYEARLRSLGYIE